VRVGDPEALAVALLKDDVPPYFGLDALEMQRMDGEPALGGLSSGSQDAQGQCIAAVRHFFLAALLDVMSRELAGAAAAFLSARFSLMDLPDFLDAA
jgi:hypothetical protein